MDVNEVFVVAAVVVVLFVSLFLFCCCCLSSCLYNAVSLTRVREWQFTVFMYCSFLFQRFYDKLKCNEIRVCVSCLSIQSCEKCYFLRLEWLRL